MTRRPSPNISFLPGFRILKRDIRRRYAEMFNNVFNSHDPMMIVRFLQTFAAPDCRLADTISADISSRTVFQSTFVIGVAGIMKLLAVHAYMIPDMVLLLHEAKVCKRSDQRGSKVVAHVTLRGTHLFIPDVPIGRVEVDEQGAIRSDQFQLQSCPKGVCIEGVFVFHLDELHRMRVLELSCDKYSESYRETWNRINCINCVYWCMICLTYDGVPLWMDKITFPKTRSLTVKWHYLFQILIERYFNFVLYNYNLLHGR